MRDIIYANRNGRHYKTVLYPNKKGKCMKNYIIHINYFEKLVRENFRNGRM